MTARNHILKPTDCNPKISVREDGYLSEDPTTWLRPDDTLMADGFNWAWCYVWFKSVPDFPDYCAGTNGTIWGNSYFGPKKGMVGRWRRLKPCKKKRKTGYRQVHLRKPGGKSFSRSVHTVVLCAFVGPAPMGMECRHIDGDSGNNSLSNIRWGTAKENSGDKRRHKRMAKLGGNLNGQAKLNELQVREILILGKTGMRQVDIGKQFGVAQATVGRILTGKTWQEITA